MAFDVVGYEPTFPLSSKSSPMYKGVALAKEGGVPLTVHAGEWPQDECIENVRFALDELEVSRIGHGIQIGRYPDLLQRPNLPPLEVLLTKRNNIEFTYCFVLFILSMFRCA